MSGRVAIAGIAQTKYESKKAGALADVIFEATSRALENAGLPLKDIESVVLAAHDMIDGRAITSMLTAPPAGAYLKDEVRVADDGSLALVMACLRLLSGDFNTSLVVSWAKCSESLGGTFHQVHNLSFDPFFYRPFALNDITSHAIQAQQYMHKYGITEAQAASVVQKNRASALGNSYAHLRTKVSIDEVLKSKPLAWPVKELDIPPLSDGACALVITTEQKARRLKGPFAWIKGFGWANDTYFLGDKDLAELPSLSQAARQAYKMAGIDKPGQEIDVAEVHDVTSFHELMEYEALGFCEHGEGGRYIEQNLSKTDGKLPVNPSGGCLSSNPYTATGLIRIAEAALQIMGKADGHQIANAKTALAHGISGLCGQSNCVFILGK